MKIVINDEFGGFGLSDKAKKDLKNLGYDYDSYRFDDIIKVRSNPILINYLETHDLKECAGRCCVLCIVEVPDNYTDIRMTEYDGAETITYVLDGKMHDI